MRCVICKDIIDYESDYADTSSGPVCYFCIDDLVRKALEQDDGDYSEFYD